MKVINFGWVVFSLIIILILNVMGVVINYSQEICKVSN